MIRKLCPDDEKLMDFIEGRLSERQRAKVETHLAGCNLCRDQVAVCTDLIDGQAPADLVMVPERVTQRAVDRVARLSVDAARQSAFDRTRQRVVKGMAVFERLVPWGEPVPVALRGETVVSEHLIRRKKRFEDVDVTIEIEKSGTGQALIRTFAVQERQMAAPLRVTLFKGEREVASMLLSHRPVIFEDIAFGVYTLVFARDSKIGEYAFEIGEQPESKT